MSLHRIARLLKALADETRLRLVHALWRGQARPWSVGELVEVLGLPQPTVSRHLAVLREEGLVERSTAGTFRYYSLAETQPRLHAAVLAALEEFVVAAPEAREDAERLFGIAKSTPERLTANPHHVTKGLPDSEAAMSHVFKALGHPVRRQILDAVSRRPGATLGAVAADFDQSRVAISKHVATLERAGLVRSRRRGRERRLYADPMPVQLMVDRWTDRFSRSMAERMSDIKHRSEEAARD